MATACTVYSLGSVTLLRLPVSPELSPLLLLKQRRCEPFRAHRLAHRLTQKQEKVQSAPMSVLREA